MDASFFSKPLSQLECRDNKKSCHLLEKKGTHPMRMHDNNTRCNRSNQNARLPDTHSCSTNQHPAAPDTTKTACYRSAAQCWKALLVFLSRNAFCVDVNKRTTEFQQRADLKVHNAWILYGRGRVWVQQLSSTEGHHWFLFLRWLTQFFIVCLCMQMSGGEKSHCRMLFWQ